MVVSIIVLMNSAMVLGGPDDEAWVVLVVVAPGCTVVVVRPPVLEGGAGWVEVSWLVMAILGSMVVGDASLDVGGDEVCWVVLVDGCGVVVFSVVDGTVVDDVVPGFVVEDSVVVVEGFVVGGVVVAEGSVVVDDGAGVWVVGALDVAGLVGVAFSVVVAAVVTLACVEVGFIVGGAIVVDNAGVLWMVKEVGLDVPPAVSFASGVVCTASEGISASFVVVVVAGTSVVSSLITICTTMELMLMRNIASGER